MRSQAGEGLVAQVKTYRVDVERDGRFWYIRVPDVERSTQARTLREVEPMARDLIAIMDEVPADSFGLDVHIKLPRDVARELEESAALREQAARDQSEAARLLRNAACHLHSQGLPLRDVGIALGVSYQRAHQLVEEAKHLVEALSRLPEECQTSAARTGRAPLAAMLVADPKWCVLL